MAAIVLFTNAVYSALTDMCINLRVDDHDLGNYAKYYNMFKVGVEPYNKYFRIINTDNVPTYVFNGANTILSTTYPAISEATVTLDQFRQIELSVEHFRSKTAMGSATVFSEFVSNVEAWLSDTFALFMGSMANVYIGVTAPGSGSAAKKSQTVTFSKSTGSGNANEESLLRIRAGEAAQAVQRIIDEMKDARTDYNSLGFRRSTSAPIIIWNEKYARMLKSGLSGSTQFNQVDLQLNNVMPERFFGVLATAAIASADGSKDRAAVEQDITVSSVDYHLMPGDLIPTGGAIAASSGLAYQCASAEGSGVTANDVVCKILDPDAIIFLEGDKTATSFENPKGHTRNNWLTWGYGVGTDTGKALVTLKAAIAT